jgi:5-methylcytosine-specific restriction protein B
MARFVDPPRSRAKIDELIPVWEETCLIGDGSILFGQRPIWTTTNLIDFRGRFLGQAAIYGTKQNFEEKLAEQLADAGDDVRILAAELLAVYFLFAFVAIGTERKIELIRFAAGDAWDDVAPGWPQVREAMTEGIGNPGGGYSIRRELQIGYLIDFATRWKELAETEQRHLLEEPWALRDFADAASEGIAVREMRHILLHLIHPESFERMSSAEHKRQIIEAFGPEFLTGDDVPEDRDEQLLLIREALERAGVQGEPMLDFYRPPLNDIWKAGAGDDEGLDDLSLLAYKKQLVLYGPPGTSKTHRTRELAETLIRRDALRKWGVRDYFEKTDELESIIAANVEWVQLHPGYGYEDIVVGLRLDGDTTVYEPGRLLRFIEKTKAATAQGLPTVLVLDEINRTDLSRMFGEVFSLLENRGTVIDLAAIDEAGRPIPIQLPDNLYLIGTMNLIDQSIEQLDFALRRRFFWRHCGFEREPIIEINRARWDHHAPRRYGWDRAAEDVERLADRAELLNEAITASNHLGPQYELGHTYYFDAAFFAGSWLQGVKQLRGGPLWNKAAKPQRPLIELWKLSLEPILAQYLEGIDPTTASEELDSLRVTLLEG